MELIRGVCEVKFDVETHGGQMNGSMIRIIDNDAGKELSIFVYESELKRFTGDLSFGVELLETSRWHPDENEIK